MFEIFLKKVFVSILSYFSLISLGWAPIAQRRERRRKRKRREGEQNWEGTHRKAKTKSPPPPTTKTVCLLGHNSPERGLELRAYIQKTKEGERKAIICLFSTNRFK